jgi:uncharacterized membrane protein (UPF0127 family)
MVVCRRVEFVYTSFVMSTYRQILLGENGRSLLKAAKWCDGFGSKLRGFTFRRHLEGSDGLVLVEKKDSRVSTAIHMLFVFFELGVIWVNDAGEVVDKVLAKPWRLSYTPQAPARYVIELHPSLLDEVKIGDYIEFLEKET